ncbi:Glycosyltransferase involved in cell wall bisynthesis [Xylanibacter ruminicola]|uniref:Glycosyltransferase involved in cell wall bisynthesis n=2 Tax=Xylanibacter ruminicola TaxID=839 RepID=A0A1H5V824_XYLRU|nr:Glycosyltransferase involved in cell wall bisynthesis [Xylanibacter ruminicola]
MHVVLDLLHIRTPIYMGIANMAYNLAKGFHDYSKCQVSVLVWAEMSGFIAGAIDREMHQIVLPDRLKDVPRYRRGLCPSRVKELLAENKVDVILTTYFNLSSYVYPKAYHQICVVHDMQPFKNELDESHYYRALKWLLQSVAYYRLVPHIVTISQYVRGDVRRYSGKDPVVIYNSISERTAGEQRIKEIENIPYILDVNTFWKYKNTERLILAFCAIKDRIPHHLYLKGVNDNEDRYEDLSVFIDRLGVKDRVILDISNRSEEEMNYLYSHASLFVSPSLREGFGLTPIEASLHKVPVVVSNIETLLEVTDGLVDSFDPKSVESIAKVMLNALQHPPSSAELEGIAAHYKEKYSCKCQIDAYMRLVESVANMKN